MTKRRKHHDDTVASSTRDDAQLDVKQQKPITIREGDRLARDFDGTIYFGQVETCHTTGKNEKECCFDVLFDDGEVYQLDLPDVTAALKLYQACKRKERNDPQIQSKINSMKSDFKKEKQKILRQLPDELKVQFLEIGFAQFDHRSAYMPCLFLSPFDVAWSVRTHWLDKFKRAKDSTAGFKDFPRLVYWYGEKSIEKSFSLISAKKCLSYEEACEIGVANMPKDIQKKVRKRKRLGKNEEKVYSIWKLMEEELDKSPADRILFEKPKEDYELVQSGERLCMEIEAELGLLTKTSDVVECVGVARYDD